MENEKKLEPVKDYIFRANEHLKVKSACLDKRIKPNPPSFQNSFAPNDVYFVKLGRGRLIGQEFFCQSFDYRCDSKAFFYLTSQGAVEKKQVTNTVVYGDSDCTYVSCSNAGFNNFYHWMYQSLPAILQALKAFEGQKFKIVIPPSNSFRQRTVELLKIPDENIHYLGLNETLECDDLVFCNLTSGDFSFRPSLYLKTLYNKFFLTVNQQVRRSFEPPRKVFISRKDSPKRGISNESEVSSLLKRYGFTEVLMSSLSLEEQVVLFNRADVIVAPHGAGLVNLVFGKEDLKVLELIPSNYINDCFYRICVLNQQNYFNLYADSIGNTHYHYTESKVDIGLLEEKLILMNLKKESV